jgi:hypothetical protein
MGICKMGKLAWIMMIVLIWFAFRNNVESLL